MSVPVAPIASRAATAEADPPDDPPGTSTAVASCLRFQGFSTGPYAEVMFDDPMANSSMFALPRNTAPSRSRMLRHRALIRRHERPEDLAAGRRPHPRGAEQVLDRQRNPGQRPRIPRRQRRIRRPGLIHRLGMADGDVGIQPRVQRLDRMQMRHGQVNSREFLRPQPVASLGDRQVCQHHSTTFGTA